MTTRYETTGTRLDSVLCGLIIALCVAVPLWSALTARIEGGPRSSGYAVSPLATPPHAARPRDDARGAAQSGQGVVETGIARRTSLSGNANTRQRGAGQQRSAPASAATVGGRELRGDQFSVTARL
jgi:hypothetical protein